MPAQNSVVESSSPIAKLDVNSIITAQQSRKSEAEHIKSNEITSSHLKKAMKMVNELMSDQDIHDMIDEADRTHAGKVCFEDFERMMRKTGLW